MSDSAGDILKFSRGLRHKPKVEDEGYLSRLRRMLGRADAAEPEAAPVESDQLTGIAGRMRDNQAAKWIDRQANRIAQEPETRPGEYSDRMARLSGRQSEIYRLHRMKGGE